MNPGSRSGKSQGRFQMIMELLDYFQVTYDYRITTSLEEAYQLSLEGNLAGYDVIVAVGGDGTINRVLNGFYDDSGQIRSKAKLGVIYTGTSPDFCKSYGIPIDIEGAVKALIKPKSKKVQVGKIILAKAPLKEFDGKSVHEMYLKENGLDGLSKLEAFKTCYFACCVNIGLGADLARRANSGIRGILGDRIGTFLALLRTLTSYKPENFMICSDGKREVLRNVHNISIGRTFYIASGIKVRHDLKDEDRRFYRMTVQDIKVRDLPGIIKRIYSGTEIINNNKISLDYSEVIDVFGNSRRPEVEFDGDPAGFLPCRISMAHDALELITG
jgi:diacylglycerol kinase family enzyme